jgi:uncharacterized cupredoxin-like copper-binding protein
VAEELASLAHTWRFAVESECQGWVLSRSGGLRTGGSVMRRSWQRSLIVLLGTSCLIGLAACSSNDDEGEAAASSAATCDEISPAAMGGVEATEKDFAIALSPSEAPAGDVTFDIKNEGPQTHEFVVFKTNLDPADLPTNDDGTVDEEGAGVKHIDEVEDIATCTSESLSVSLAAGNYVIICNLPDHYASGMHTAFTVT